MTAPVYDSKGQFQQIQSGLLEGEQIIAVYDAVGAGTGFIGLTNRRIIIQDKSFAGKRRHAPIGGGGRQCPVR